MPFLHPVRPVSVLICLFLAVGPVCAQTPLRNYTDHEVGPSSITVWADTSGLRLTWYRSDVVEVELLPSRSTTHDSSLVVARKSEGVPVNVWATPGALHASTRGITAHVQKEPVRLQLTDASGQSLLEEPASAGFTASSTTRTAQFELPSQTHFYGTGERGIGIDLRGERFRNDNQQHYGYNGVLPTMNINVPLLLTSEGYALLFDTPYPGTFDLGAQNPSTFSYEADGGELSYFVLAGESIPEQLDGYTWLTGRPPMPPKWALGYLQSKYGYRSADAARDVANRLRDEDIPADGLILDLYWFENMGDLSWDNSSFPDPSGMIDDLEANGIKTIVISEPYFAETSDWFSAMIEDGAPRPAQTGGGEPYRLQGWWSCGCDAVLADMTHGPTQDWWTERYADIMDAGVHGFWTDLGEPEAHPPSMQHVGGSADAVHNVYNLLWARTVHETFSEQRPNRRVVNLTRSGYAGIQRYGVFTWSGDVNRSFTGLSVQPTIMLNSSLSGLYYHSSDLGGFTGEGSSELYARWMQMGALTPVARPHGVDNEPTEPWGFGSEALSISRKYVKLRYRLLPYLYTMAYRAHDRGMPIVRPLFFENPDADRLSGRDDAYLFGDSFLVAPVVERGKRSKEVPLPSGSWVNYWTDESVSGRQTITVDAPLDRLPLFVKQGAIIPMRPTAPDYVGRSVADTLELAVYPSEDGGRFTLYEDDGYTQAYAQSNYALTSFEQKKEARDEGARYTVALGPTRGSFEGRPTERVYHTVLHRVADPPSHVTLDGRILADRETPTALRDQGSGYAYDAEAERLHMRAAVADRRPHELQAYTGDGPIAVQAAAVGADTTVVFGEAGLGLTFNGVAAADTVSVSKYGTPPTNVGNLAEDNVASYRFVVSAGDALRFDSATVDIGVRSVGDLGAPTNVTVYTREQPGAGPFAALPTRVDDNGTPGDASDDTLSVTTTSFSEFILVSESGSPSLELEAFDATVEEAAVRLTWRPLYDARNATFHVQRRVAARTARPDAQTNRRAASAEWERVGQLDGTDTIEPGAYRFVDEPLPEDVDSLSYRLKQTNANDVISYSTPITIQRPVERVQLRPPAPNPVRRRVSVHYAVPEGQDATLRLYDVLGRQVKTLPVSVGENGERRTIQLDLSDVASGAYFLRLRTETAVETRRVTVVQ